MIQSTSTQKEFVFVKRDIKSAGLSIRENEIGIVTNKSNDLYSIFFITASKNLDLPKKDFEPFDVKQTGDLFAKKVCNVCHRLLDTTKFSRNQNGINNRVIRRPSCDECRKIIDGKNVPAKVKKEWEEKKPCLEPFTCPICLKTTIPDLTSKVVLDHDHNTGTVRGWICDSCNTGIGRFKDDVTLLERAIQYLKKG